MIALLAVATAGCGKGSPKITTEGSTTTSTTPVVESTTAVPATATLDVKPQSIRVGAAVTLTATKLQPQEVVKFEIDMPGGKTFTGGQHTADAAGTVTASYRTAAGTNPVGAYTVKVTGDKGSTGSGSFTVTAGAPSTTAKPSASGSSTTVAKATTSTTAKPRSSTTTAQHTTTTHA